MRIFDLGLVYALVGIACAVAIARAELAEARGGDAAALAAARVRAGIHAAIAVPLWPIWAPLVLTRGGASEGPRTLGSTGPGAADPRVGRAATALAEAAEACAGTPFERLLSRDAVHRIAGEIGRVAARHAELAALLADVRYDARGAEGRVAALEAEGAGARAVATAKLHLDNVKRLAALRDRDGRALDELGELAHALRTQLALARFAGSNGDQAGDIVAEVLARIEGLAAANEGLEPVVGVTAGGA